MVEDDGPRLADWLAEYRRRAEPTEVVVATYDPVEPVPDVPDEGLSAGQVARDVIADGHYGKVLERRSGDGNAT